MRFWRPLILYADKLSGSIRNFLEMSMNKERLDEVLRIGDDGGDGEDQQQRPDDEVAPRTVLVSVRFGFGSGRLCGQREVSD